MPGMFEEEPEVLDESDSRIADELHETLKVMGVRPEELPNPGDADQYRDWLGASTRQLSDYRSPIQEQQLDFLLEEEFACNPSFLNFFVSTALAAKNQVAPALPVPHSNWNCNPRCTEQDNQSTRCDKCTHLDPLLDRLTASQVEIGTAMPG